MRPAFSAAIPIRDVPGQALSGRRARGQVFAGRFLGGLGDERGVDLSGEGRLARYCIQATAAAFDDQRHAGAWLKAARRCGGSGLQFGGAGAGADDAVVEPRLEVCGQFARRSGTRFRLRRVARYRWRQLGRLIPPCVRGSELPARTAEDRAGR
jgi:hypothetical protein